MRQRLVFVELLVPPGDALLVQAPLEFLADAQQPLLIGLLEAQALLDQLRVEVPLQPRERLDAEAVGAEPVEPLVSAPSVSSALAARQLASQISSTSCGLVTSSEKS